MTASDSAETVNMLYRLYAFLSNELVGHRWRRQHVWNERAAVFEFTWGAKRLFADEGVEPGAVGPSVSLPG